MYDESIHDEEDRSLGLLGQGWEDKSEFEVTVSEIFVNTENNETSYTWNSENDCQCSSSELSCDDNESDEVEVKRLDEQRRIFTQVVGGQLHFVPLPNKDELKILDLACGSGIWCIEMAERYPKASIFGMDSSPTQPMVKAANVHWETWDMEDEWPFPENYFDLIHLSLVHGSTDGCDTLLAKIKRHLVPGGWVEQHEMSFATQYLTDDEQSKETLTSDNASQMTPYMQWTKLMKQASEIRGWTLLLGPELAPMQTAAGFEDVNSQVFHHEWGSWPSDQRERDLDTRTMQQMVGEIEGLTSILLEESLDWSHEDTRKLLVDVRRNMEDDSLSKVMDLHVVYGRKPIGPPSRTEVKEPNGGSSVSAALAQSPGLQLNSLVVATIVASFVLALTHWTVYRK